MMKFEDYIKTNYNIGDVVWVCDYRFLHNYIDKPIRHVRPTKVMVDSNENLPKNKQVYYSEIHFKVIGSNGNPTKQIISPFDNTGFRSYNGVALQVFLTKEEAINYYKLTCSKIVKLAELEKLDIIKQYDELISKLKEV